MIILVALIQEEVNAVTFTDAVFSPLQVLHAKFYMISVKSYLWKLHTDTSCLDLKKLELSCISSRVPNKKINQGKCIYIYKFKKYLKLDIGRQKHSPLISGTFPRWRACNVVVASARGGKERCGFLWYAAPSQVCLHRHSCSDLCS